MKPILIHSLKNIWQWSTRLSRKKRVLLKISVYIVILFFVLFPKPFLFIKQINNYKNIESLIQTDFPELKQINSSIDSLINHDTSQEMELKIIQWYVFQNIPYKNDWDLWKNCDYWPNAEETWRKGAEDCDGRAILAVSIMRSRGHENAGIAGNILHIWAEVDSIGLMNAMEEKTISVSDGKTKIKLPSFKLFLNTIAYLLEEFPAVRFLLLIFTFLIFAYHPNTNITGFLFFSSTFLLSFVLLKDWAIDTNNSKEILINFNFIIGCFLFLASVICSVYSEKLILKKSKSKKDSSIIKD